MPLAPLTSNIHPNHPKLLYPFILLTSYTTLCEHLSRFSFESIVVACFGFFRLWMINPLFSSCLSCIMLEKNKRKQTNNKQTHNDNNDHIKLTCAFTLHANDHNCMLLSFSLTLWESIPHSTSLNEHHKHVFLYVLFERKRNACERTSTTTEKKKRKKKSRCFVCSTDRQVFR